MTLQTVYELLETDTDRTLRFPSFFSYQLFYESFTSYYMVSLHLQYDMLLENILQQINIQRKEKSGAFLKKSSSHKKNAVHKADHYD